LTDAGFSSESRDRNLALEHEAVVTTQVAGQPSRGERTILNTK
jgi:hypothetical protein